MTLPRRWHKSSRSQNGSQCVEVAHTLDALRDSKNPTGPVLVVGGLAGFLGELKRGRLSP